MSINLLMLNVMKQRERERERESERSLFGKKCQQKCNIISRRISLSRKCENVSTLICFKKIKLKNNKFKR
jgi:hypothetical protein